MEKKKIMVVDDEPDIREILQFNLENAGYEVVPASSAETALELCDQDVDLILLDVMMEGMSGFKMAEVLRKERRSQIPVIFLTARSAENDLLTGFSAGGDDYISKGCPETKHGDTSGETFGTDSPGKTQDRCGEEDGICGRRGCGPAQERT